MLNEYTDNMLKDYPATLAIVVYVGENNEYYLEGHDIEDGKLMEGKPLMEETIFAIANLFNENNDNAKEFSGILPECLLHFEKKEGRYYDMIWYRPAERRQIYFSDNLHIPSGEAWVPPLVYKVSGNGLNVLALPGDERPDMDTLLYMPPFHNVNSDGDVCLGSAKVNKKKVKKTYLSEIEYWEAMFWNSEFSHLAGTDNPTKSNLSILWTNQVNNNIKWPMEELMPTKKTFKSLFK